MNRKIVLVMVMGYFGIMEEVYANSPTPKSLQFYVGASGGISRMTGRRKEDVFVPIAIPPETVTFTDNRYFRDNNAQYSGFAGVAWLIPQTGIFIEPEIHLGKTHTENKTADIIYDQAAADQRTLTGTISQSIFWGAVAKVGYRFASYKPYVIVGGEASQFQHYAAYIPFAPDAPVFFKSRKWLKGFLWGFGLEKHVNCLRFGAEVRFINYRAYKAKYNSFQTNEIVNTTFTPKSMRFSLRVSYVF